MKRTKKKTSVFEKKNLVVMALAAAFVAAIAFAMSALLPNEEKANTTFDRTAWDEAVKEAELSLEKKLETEDSGLTSVHKDEAVSANAEAYPANAEKKEEAPEEEPVKISGYAMPINGAISNDYSGEELVYSETMQDWRTHNGIDIAADEGTDVLAAADGTVEAITDNSMLGTTVIIIHEGGVRTIYSNLATDPSVEIGAAVKAGVPIGKVGSTAALEASEQSHLHFEMSLNEETVNPHDYIAKNTQ